MFYIYKSEGISNSTRIVVCLNSQLFFYVSKSTGVLEINWLDTFRGSYICLRVLYLQEAGISNTKAMAMCGFLMKLSL